MSQRNPHRLVLMAAVASLACAPAPRSGDAVHIAEESAIIIWDAATKTQHFIRRAKFETRAKDFGFLVPTPTVPKLEEADDAAFDHLARVTAPEVRRLPPEVRKKSAPKPAAAAPAVVVVAEAKVAGYDAVVLEATDAGALNQWLKERDYASSPELVEWFKPYVAQGWRISAFKIARGAQDDVKISTKAVRMSFQTDRPFFPYREPASQRKAVDKGNPAPRMLRVYFLGDARVGGTIGAVDSWPGVAAWSGPIESADRDRLLTLAKLPDGTAPAALWLTEFEDRSSPRPGTDDLFFARSADQTAFKRDPVYDYEQNASGHPFVFLGIALIALACGAWLLFVIGRWFWRGWKG